MNCTICNTKLAPAFIKHGYKIVRCPKCFLYQTILKGSYQDMIKNYYTKAYFTGNSNRAGYADYDEDATIVQANAKKYLQILTAHGSNRSLLDVGCATGTFLDTAKKAGWDGWGIDVSKYAISKAKKKFESKVKHGILKNNTFGSKKFHAVTLLDVFEHIGNPRSLLKTAKKLLKPKGILVINTGDSSSLMAKIEGKKWHYFIPPQHVFFYSQHNIKTLLQSEGFKVKRIYHHGKWLSLRYLLHLMRTINHSLLANILYKIVHKNAIGRLPLYINLRDNMTVIAQKN